MLWGASYLVRLQRTSSGATETIAQLFDQLVLKFGEISASISCILWCFLLCSYWIMLSSNLRLMSEMWLNCSWRLHTLHIQLCDGNILTNCRKNLVVCTHPYSVFYHRLHVLSMCCSKILVSSWRCFSFIQEFVSSNWLMRSYRIHSPPSPHGQWPTNDQYSQPPGVNFCEIRWSTNNDSNHGGGAASLHNKGCASAKSGC